MDIERLTWHRFPQLPETTNRQDKPEKSEKDQDFGDTLKTFLKEVNQLQAEAADHVEALVTGETVDIHDVMIAMEKASVSFEMVMEIRNKILEAYQELIRTQV